MELSFKDRAARLIEILFQQLLAFLVLLILWEVFKNYELKNIGTWHIILCTLGFALCMIEALLLFNSHNAVFNGVDRTKRTTFHALVMTLACVFITTGISLKIYQKNERSADHFTTIHGRLGLTSWILVIISIFGGIAASYAKNLKSLGKPVWYRLCHLIFGLAAYIIGIVTLGFGLHYLEAYTGVGGRNALIVIMSLAVAYSLIGSIKSFYNYVTSLR